MIHSHKSITAGNSTGSKSQRDVGQLQDIHLAPSWAYMVATAVIVLFVYAKTLAPDLTWANASMDGGELITASATLGIPHPPGYLTYVLLGKLFSFIPIGTIAFRYNLFSSVSMAIAAGLLVGTINQLARPTVKPVVASAAATVFAFMPLVWSQAIVSEVYALNVCVLSAFLFVTSRYGARFGSGFLFGLAMTTHLTSILMLPLACLLPVPRRWSSFFLGLLIGLTPLLAAPVLALGNSPVVWGEPTTLAGWWWLVSGQIYRPNIQWNQEWDRLFGLLRMSILGAGLIVAGHHRFSPSIKKPIREFSTRWQTQFTLAATAGLYFLFAIVYKTPDAPVVSIPALMLLAIILAPVLRPLKTLSLLLPLILALYVFPSQNLSQDREIRPMAESILKAAPEGAVLLTPGDRTVFTLWYFHHVERQRPDVYLIDSNLFAFDWYRERLARLYPELSVPFEDDLAALQARSLVNNPFCVTGLISESSVFSAPQAYNDLISDPDGPYLYCLESNP